MKTSFVDRLFPPSQIQSLCRCVSFVRHNHYEDGNGVEVYSWRPPRDTILHHLIDRDVGCNVHFSSPIKKIRVLVLRCPLWTRRFDSNFVVDVSGRTNLFKYNTRTCI